MPKKIKYCAICKPCERDVEADYFVKGKTWSPYNPDRMIPYRGYLCWEHLMYMEEDGAILEIVEYVSEYAKKKLIQDTKPYLDKLTRKFTVYFDFYELCRNNATLRPDTFYGEERKQMEALKKYYAML